MTLTSACPAPTGGASADFTSLGEIDRAGVAFCTNAYDAAAVTAVQRYRMFRMRCLTTTLAAVDEAGPPPRALVSVRLKRLDSIRRKINRGATRFGLGRMDDVVGVRVVCPSYRTARSMSRRIRALPQFYRLKDYLDVEHPAATGYRATHHIMRFRQPLTETDGINVRFEIQVRSYYQHQWAVWSEFLGESVKEGGGTADVRRDLRVLSDRIARWEERNPRTMQHRLPVYSGGRDIVVAWKQEAGEPICYGFLRDVGRAVQWLNYLETKYPVERGNALLLVGVTSPGEATGVLHLTHPLYTMPRLLAPEYWMPLDS